LVLILRLPRRRWSLPPHWREGRQWDAVEERLSVPLFELPCPLCRAEADGMECLVIENGILPTLVLTLSLI
jgi:hypothetical protein